MQDVPGRALFDFLIFFHCAHERTGAKKEDLRSNDSPEKVVCERGVSKSQKGVKYKKFKNFYSHIQRVMTFYFLTHLSVDKGSEKSIRKNLLILFVHSSSKM